MKTYMATPSTIERKWYVVDAADKTLGRLAAEVAKVLRGKNKPTFTPHMDTGDHVIIINAAQVRLTGKKLTHKIYFRHSGYLGGDKYVTAGDMLKKNPVRMVEMAVRGMVPHNRLGADIIKKLHVYAGPEHPHAAQKPEVLTIDIR
jgi:large subunit ribosomal protein L13